MVKALLKKQMLEIFAWIYRNQKTGKHRDKKGVIGFSVLYLCLLGYLGVVFYFMADMLCGPMVSIGFGWLYIALAGLLSVTLGVLGSVFSTYATLYQAKDNDLLLSMPVTVNQVLYVRLVGVYLMGLMYGLPVMLPSLIVYFRYVQLHLLPLLFCILIPVVLSFFVLSLSCILGWVVALVSSRLKNQKIISVIVCLAFLGGYYYLCGNMSTLLQGILMNPYNFADKVKGILYPLYQMGMAAEGNVLSMVIFTAIIAAVFVLVYGILHRSFLKLATTNRGSKRVRYIHKKSQCRSVATALLFKEFRRFLGSFNYMMNCGLGIVFMLAFGVYVLIKPDTVAVFGLLIGDKSLLAMIACGIICMMVTMNDITAPSVSLEGKNIWLVQVFPVSAWQVLKAKLSLHLILTAIPAAVLTACILAALKLSIVYWLLMVAVVLLFVLFMAIVGLVLNLKMPNLNWTNENAPIKQSAPVTLTLFGGWAAVLFLGGLYYLLRNVLTPMVYLALAAALLAVVIALLLRWLKNSGSKIFDNL